MRSLFSRPDMQLLVDKIAGTEDAYWRAVLEVCAAGNLQAVLDEYLFHLRGELHGPLNDELLARLALDAHRALSLRPARYITKDPLNGGDIPFRGRFARRLGSKRGDSTGPSDLNAMPEIRRAFNSPFWPFVLATTSVGQEGIDLHWWCHAVVHWNTPSSPVDFEQREGRVHRFGGHVIRRNIAAAHGPEMLKSKSHPWTTGWELASAESFEHGDLSPHWIYPGPYSVERHVYRTSSAETAPDTRSSSGTSRCTDSPSASHAKKTSCRCWNNAASTPTKTPCTDFASTCGRRDPWSDQVFKVRSDHTSPVTMDS